MTIDTLETPPEVINLDTIESSPAVTLPDGYIPKDQRKTILLLSDDLRLPSGVGVMSREIVLKTAHKYNWVQVGAAVQHAEQGKIMDASESLSVEIGIPDASLKIYPYSGYGNPNLIRYLMMVERPNMILPFTDPRFWIWLFEMEHELREHVPILYYHVWDDLPFPKYNEDYYRSCDSIASMSKQTYNIVKQVCEKDPKTKEWETRYIPLGSDSNIFRPIRPDETAAFEEFKQNVFQNRLDDIEFTVLYNNRNIRRKMTGDVILAFKSFVEKLPVEKQNKCLLLMHTAPVDDNGTDLLAVFRDVAPNINHMFTPQRLPPQMLNFLYNISDVVINLASNEGFGISTTEAMLAEKLIVANVTGGLQDQMGFVDEDGNLLKEDVHYTKEWSSNHDGKYKNHGEWAFPCFPTQRALIGSPPTPYIFDDRCDWEDAAQQLLTIYNMPKEERERRGKLGREFAMNTGLTSQQMGQSFITLIEDVFANWTPRQRFILEKV